MKILFCNYEYPPLGGGGGIINALLAEELAKRHEVTVLTSQGLGLPGEPIVNGVRVVRVPVYFRRQQAAANLPSMFAYMVMGKRVRGRLFGETSYDIINTHFVIPSGPVGDALSRYGRIPNVISVHGGDLYDPSKKMSPHRHWFLRRWIRTLLRRADAVIGQSRNTLKNMRRYYTPEIEGVRIPLGIQRPPESVAERPEYGLRESDTLLVTVGRLVARKAVEQLIALVRELPGDHAHLLIVGTGPEEERLRRQAQQSGVSDRIHFMSHVNEVEKFRILRMSDLFVSSSQHEGFGLVFLEAMACGLPVVCYDHGGQTDFLSSGKTGHVVKLNDLADLEGACRELLGNRKLRQEMGGKNQKAVEAYFIDRCTKQYERVFEEVIARKRR
ncbi:MAG: glycosyltransferase family 4 protein [Pseudomonadota bacterium]